MVVRPAPSVAVSGVPVLHPADLAEILGEDCNVCLLQRPPPEPACGFAREVLSLQRLDRSVRCEDPGRGAEELVRGLDGPGRAGWVEDVRWLAELYRDLTEADELGLRLHASDRSMCPGFHVDRIGLRLVCTYAGPGTEWLQEPQVDRGALARRALAEVHRGGAVERMVVGAIGLLKGESWPGNEGRGAVHRSPALPPGQRRVLLTIDGWFRQ
jgi:hypothetical protein